LVDEMDHLSILMVVDDVSEDKENLGEGASIRAGAAAGGAAILLLSCLSLVRRL
jgi:hypothetical protein